MIGAIVGDYIGSAYEFAPTKEYNFPLVTAGSSITDDSIMSLAVADAILKDEQQPYFRAAMLYYGKRYPTPKGSYGNSFMRWLNSPTPEPYNSFGNGSAMRVSAVGWAYDTLEETQEQADMLAEMGCDQFQGYLYAKPMPEQQFVQFLAEAGCVG